MGTFSGFGEGTLNKTIKDKLKHSKWRLYAVERVLN
jgi:hypothetical protein